MAINKSLTWYPNNDTVVDSGTGLDVRAMIDASGVNDTSQSWTATHSEDNQHRVFDPATEGTGSVTGDPNTTWHGVGWAIPLSALTPDDNRCKALIPAQSATCYMVMDLGYSGSEPLGSSAPTGKCTLWKYNVTTDAATHIQYRQFTFSDWGGLGGTSYGLAQYIELTFDLPDIIMESDEILVAQFGCYTGTLSNPLLGTTTYTANLHIGEADDTRFIFSKEIQLLCSHTDTHSADGSGLKQSVSIVTDKALDADGDGAKSLIIVSKEKNVDALGGGAKILGVYYDDNSTGEISITRISNIGHSNTGEILGSGSKSLHLEKSVQSNADGESAFTRWWEAFRDDTASADGSTEFDRTVVFVRSATVNGEGYSDPNEARISLPMSDLPTGSGTVNIRKIFPIFEG